jgi:hypothetical protein
MLIGDVIARLEDDGEADEALLALGDLALTARVASAAAREAMTRGEFVATCVGRLAHSSDEQWVSVLGQMGRTDDPGRVFLRRAIEIGLAGDASQGAA